MRAAAGELVPLPGLGAPPALTERQAFALEVIREHGPIPSDELGAELCARNLRHSNDLRCGYDRSNGHAIGRALRRKGLVRFRQRAGWYVPGSRHRPESDEPFEWPEGF